MQSLLSITRSGFSQYPGSFFKTRLSLCKPLASAYSPGIFRLCKRLQDAAAAPQLSSYFDGPVTEFAAIFFQHFLGQTQESVHRKC